MPANDSCGLDDPDVRAPTCPTVRSDRPETPIGRLKPRAMATTLVDRELLAQNDVLENQVLPFAAKQP